MKAPLTNLSPLKIMQIELLRSNMKIHKEAKLEQLTDKDAKNVASLFYTRNISD